MEQNRIEQIETLVTAKLQNLPKIKELKIPIKPEDDFLTDLGLDSMDLLEVIFDIEKEIKTTIPNEVLSQLRSFSQIRKYLEQV